MTEKASRKSPAKKTAARRTRKAVAAPRVGGAERVRADAVFQERLARHHDELRWLYMELFDNGDMFAELLDQMRAYYDARSERLRALDAEREAAGEWYRSRDMLGMQMYIDNFAGNIKGVEDRLDYLERVGVNYLHLMPFLDTPADRSRSDGGYAVKDFRRVQARARHDGGPRPPRREVPRARHQPLHGLRHEPHFGGARVGAAGPRRRGRVHEPVLLREQPGGEFYPYQWDLNYKNPRVFNEMMYNFLYLANQGMDIIRIDAVPYIWKQLGTNCRNLPQVHTIVRMMRMIGEVVCPGIVLLGEVVMAPVEVVPYFGTVEKPECHMLYNVTTMATTWNSVACRDTRLLRSQLDAVCGLPSQYTFLNYLRCHDDIGWGLDYATLSTWGMEEVPHKRYLNDYFQGHTPGSTSRGELYNADPVTGDARFCATTASMCGIEAAGFEGDEEAMEVAIRKDGMLHAYLLAQSGLPIIYSGDEVAQVNDYAYKDDPEKADDSRYIHRGRFDWSLVDRVDEKGSVQQRIFDALGELEAIRRREDVFDADAEVGIVDYSDPAILWIRRSAGGRTLNAVFNFCDAEKTVWMPACAEYTNLLTGETMGFETFQLPAWGFVWYLA